MYDLFELLPSLAGIQFFPDISTDVLLKYQYKCVESSSKFYKQYIRQQGIFALGDTYYMVECVNFKYKSVKQVKPIKVTTIEWKEVD